MNSVDIGNSHVSESGGGIAIQDSSVVYVGDSGVGVTVHDGTAFFDGGNYNNNYSKVK